ncbi:MAG: hypothetical protein LKM30_03085 [Bacilli bacterium]|jgi:hypothetical protein|nr:hypothetical protein [Bacilli bacterium]
MEDDAILEPLKEFKELAEKCHTNAGTFFDQLVAQSKIVEKENCDTCDNYYSLMNSYQLALKKAGGAVAAKVLLIILDVLLFVAAFFMIWMAIASGGDQVRLIVGIVLGIVFIILGVLDILLLVKKISKLVKDRKAKAAALKAEADHELKVAKNQMAPLNALFDWGMQADVIKMTTPIIQLDRNFDIAKYVYMNVKYGLGENKDPKTSTYFVQSGAILGNPFLIEREFHQIDGQKTYEGELTIEWTTYYTDSKGDSHSVTHSQTLRAYVTKFCPYYNFETYLVYSNDAAPDLSFSRQPTVKANATDKSLKRDVQKGDKQIQKMVKTALNDKDPSTNFTAMGNSEFDVLFHALDRDNEVQFRLLFTALAQKNMLALLKSKTPYGDDFAFWKRKTLNWIESVHAQTQDIYGNPATYVDFDVRSSRKKFIAYCDSYFQYLFFDLAPLISIPLYQMTKTREFMYNEPYTANLSSYENEAMANTFPEQAVIPEGCATPTIRKVNFVAKEGSCDKSLMVTHGYRTVQRVDYVSVFGGDGSYHDVPVYWDEYIPIQRQFTLVTKNADMTRYDYNNLSSNQGFSNFMAKYGTNLVSYQRKLFAFITDHDFNTTDASQLETYLKSKQ